MKNIITSFFVLASLATSLELSANLFEGSNNIGYRNGRNSCCNQWYLSGGVNHVGVFHHDADPQREEQNQYWNLGWHVFLGYQFNNCFSLESGYLNQGRPKGVDDASPYQYNGYHYVVPLTGQFSFMISQCYQIKALARLGVHYYYQKIVYDDGNRRNLHRSGADFNFGLGLQMNFNDSFGLRFVADRYYFNFLSNYDDAFQLGVVFGF